MSAKLYAVEPAQSKSTRQLAREAVADYRQQVVIGSTVGECQQHRGWSPEIVLAFLNAPVIKPKSGEIQQKLYGKQ